VYGGKPRQILMDHESTGKYKINRYVAAAGATTIAQQKNGMTL